MFFLPSVFLVCGVLGSNQLHSAAGQTTDESPSLGAQSLHSSLERSNRRYVCPGESISYSCSTFGERLTWNVNGDKVITFGFEEHATGSGATCHSGACNGVDCFVFSGVLDSTINSTQNGIDDIVPYCYSTLTVTPGQLDNITSTLYPCPEYQSLNITCTIISDDDESVIALSLPYQIANSSTEYSVSGTCFYDQTTCSLVIELQIPNNIHTDLDYFKVDLLNYNTTLGSSLVKVPVSTADGNVRTSFYATFDVYTSTDVYVNVSAFDKCGQQASRLSTITYSSTEGSPTVGGNCSYRYSACSAVVTIFPLPNMLRNVVNYEVDLLRGDDKLNTTFIKAPGNTTVTTTFYGISVPSTKVNVSVFDKCGQRYTKESLAIDCENLELQGTLPQQSRLGSCERQDNNVMLNITAELLADYYIVQLNISDLKDFIIPHKLNYESLSINVLNSVDNMDLTLSVTPFYKCRQDNLTVSSWNVTCSNSSATGVTIQTYHYATLSCYLFLSVVAILMD